MKRHEAAEASGIPMDSNLDNGLMARSRYVRMGPNENRNSTFECNECGQTYKKFSHLTQHRRAKHDFDNGFQCKICGRKYTSRYYLAKHYKRHEKQETEPEANENFSDEDDELIVVEQKPYVEIQSQQSEFEFICEICDAPFNRYDSLNEHIASMHSTTESFMCNECDNVYPNQDCLQEHMKIHQSGMEAQQDLDDLDDDLVERRQYYRVHPHRPTSKFVCDYCQKTLSSYYSMSVHMLSKHSTAEERERQGRSCIKCNRTFLSKKTLEKHHCAMDSASKAKVEAKLMCSACGRLFSDGTMLKEHELIHLGIVPFKCDICQKQFTHKPYLRKHMRTVHARERPFRFVYIQQMKICLVHKTHFVLFVYSI